jgi:Eco57I restriction-modification methylase
MTVAVADRALALRQPFFPTFCPISFAVEQMADAGIEARGAIFTRLEVVDFILDLTGYTADRPLHTMRLLEPSAGHGDFLIPALDRLLVAWQLAGAPAPETLSNAIRAIELHHASLASARLKVIARLHQAGISDSISEALANAWLIQGDFLLTSIDGTFDVVAGNPPYVRQELIPDVLMAEYRTRYATIYDRADIYVPFIERSLCLLSKDGQCGFICSDRWMKNRYGGPLRAFVARHFHLKIYADMVDTPAFHSHCASPPDRTLRAWCARYQVDRIKGTCP